jgi:hypothetical protein
MKFDAMERHRQACSGASDAARELGLNNVHHLGYCDGELDQVEPIQVIDQMPGYETLIQMPPHSTRRYGAARPSTAP